MRKMGAKREKNKIEPHACMRLVIFGGCIKVFNHLIKFDGGFWMRCTGKYLPERMSFCTWAQVRISAGLLLSFVFAWLWVWVVHFLLVRLNKFHECAKGSKPTWTCHHCCRTKLHELGIIFGAWLQFLCSLWAPFYLLWLRLVYAVVNNLVGGWWLVADPKKVVEHETTGTLTRIFNDPQTGQR
jgi:hypothetical protein